MKAMSALEGFCTLIISRHRTFSSAVSHQFPDKRRFASTSFPPPLSHSIHMIIFLEKGFLRLAVSSSTVVRYPFPIWSIGKSLFISRGVFPPPQPAPLIHTVSLLSVKLFHCPHDHVKLSPAGFPFFRSHIFSFLAPYSEVIFP